MAAWVGVQPFQTLIVGIIGFAGVITTLWFNARQARQQRTLERLHEAETLRVALIEELKISRTAAVENSTNMSSAQDVFVPTAPMDDVYRAFTGRIGLLSELEVGKVMTAYLTLRTYQSKLFLIGVPVHTGDHHVRVPVTNAPLLAGMLKNLIDPIDDAIQAMESARG